jgi:hypothetical protein
MSSLNDCFSAGFFSELQKMAADDPQKAGKAKRVRRPMSRLKKGLIAGGAIGAAGLGAHAAGLGPFATEAAQGLSALGPTASEGLNAAKWLHGIPIGR